MPALISDRWRGAARTAIVVSALVVAILGVRLHGAGTTSFDGWMLRRSVAAIGAGGTRALLRFSEPAVSLTVIVAVAVIAALGRRWRLAVLAALAPAAAVVVTEYVLKPIVDRYLYQPGVPVAVLRSTYSGAFPSGHETGVASAALLVLVGLGQLRLGRAARAGAVAVLAGWTALAALGLISSYFHYATDTAGALGVAVVVVLGGAWAIDAAVPALARRRELAPDPR